VDQGGEPLELSDFDVDTPNLAQRYGIDIDIEKLAPGDCYEALDSIW
jgi:hypothetical protein